MVAIHERLHQMEWSADFSRKRHPTDDLIEEQPLSKRLSLLSLGAEPKSPRPPLSQPEQERMEVDNVVYISDLDSDEDSDEGEKLIFLPDIERKLTRIPYSLASHKEPQSKEQSTSTELVLYAVPSSISLPEQKDNVRKAIIEARERLRQKHTEATVSGRVANNISQAVPSKGIVNGPSGNMLNGLPNVMSNRMNEVNGVNGANGANVVNGVNGANIVNGVNGMMANADLPNTQVLWNNGWDNWTPMDASIGLGAMAGYDDLDAMEIE
ncbi:hypothetical protein BDZ91DRAFT_58042 [Kalaharituber pfeilii]|nr:hypothetical protein BDZ91DRAFT_58042 [Kalaharituber pfeilii]